MPALIQNFWAQSWRTTPKNVFLHLDNACSHNSRRSSECIEEFLAHRIPQLVYSSDVTPSDFVLFGSLKIKLSGLAVQNSEELILAIRQIFDDVPKETLISIYLSWKARLT
jgi:hypothetical protein